MAILQRGLSYLDVVILADHSTLVTLPNPLADGGPLAVGARFSVEDNLGLAGGANIAITGPIAGGATGTSITTSYGSAVFTWAGNTFTQK